MKQRDIDINSNDNTLFVTQQCNNHCIMCCQPPKKIDDIEYFYRQNVKRILSAPKDLPIQFFCINLVFSGQSKSFSP